MFQLFVQFVDEREKFLAVRFLAYRMAKVFNMFVKVHAKARIRRDLPPREGRLSAILLWGKKKNLTYLRPTEVRHNAPRHS